MDDEKYLISAKRLEELSRALVEVQMGHTFWRKRWWQRKPHAHYDAQDMMGFIAQTHRVLLALIAEMRGFHVE